MKHIILKIGDSSLNRKVTILDEDRLCYVIKSISRGASGIRTISKALLKEFVCYIEKNPGATARETRDALSGKSEIDKYEYGYESTLHTLARMILGLERFASFK